MFVRDGGFGGAQSGAWVEARALAENGRRTLLALGSELERDEQKLYDEVMKEDSNQCVTEYC